MQWAASKNRETCFGCSLIKKLRVEFLTRFYKICCTKIVYTWWQSVATDGGWEQNTLTRHIFSCLHACLTVSHVTLAQGVVRVIPSMCHAPVCLISLRLSTLYSSQSLSSSTSSSWSSTSPSMWVGSERLPMCASANEESDSLVNNAPLTRGKSPSGRMFRLFCKDYFKGHQFILWKMASSRMLVLQVREWMQIWVKSALMRIARLKNRQAKGLKKMVTKCSDYAEKYTTIGLRISGYGAAEVFIDFAEELKHTETNPMCSIHKRRRTSCWHSRPKSIAWNVLPRWSSSA